MNIDPVVMATKLAELKKQLEEITGKEIDANAEQFILLFFPAGLVNYELNSAVFWKSLIIPGEFCVTPVTLLDASGRSSSGPDGKSVFLLSNFICSDFNSFSEPVHLLATPNVTNPCYMTMTHELVKNPTSPSSFSDVQITAFAWSPNGTAAPNVTFNWRCRVVSNPVLL